MIDNAAKRCANGATVDDAIESAFAELWPEMDRDLNARRQTEGYLRTQLALRSTAAPTAVRPVRPRIAVRG